MPSWTNATEPESRRPESPHLGRTASTKGVLRPDETARQADLHRDHPVDPALAPFVERYWSVHWDRTGAAPYRAEVLGHPTVNVSLEWGDRPRFGATMPAALVHGVATRRFVVDLAGRGRVTAAKFRPGGWTALTGRPPLADTIVPLRAELGLDPGELLAAAAVHDDDVGRAAVLDAALAPVVVEPDPAYLALLDVLAEMLHDRGIVRVEQAAAGAGLGVRALQRLFATFIGVGPKAVLVRYRMHDAVAALDDGEDDLAGLAASLGWFDQAHFCRDFRAVVGTTPSAYQARARAGGTR
jgi:AraC-like DNA-binding protein